MTSATPVAGSPPAAKDMLLDYLRRAREPFRWKLEGLEDYDVRRPLTPTGSNLLGIVKHAASVQVGYLGDTFGRPSPVALPWFEAGAEPNADMWATAQESRADIVELLEISCRHSDQTVAALPLDATGTVPWWPPERRTVTLAQILTHVIAELNRHAGQLDILRESIDGSAGFRPDDDNLPQVEATWWPAYVARLQQVAEGFRR